MDLFKELSNLPKRCIYGLFNDQGKKVYIGFSNNTVRTILTSVESLRYSNLGPDFQNLQFRIIETIKNSNRLRIRYQYWVSHYSNEGWGMYRDYKAIQYKVKMEIQPDETKHGSTHYFIYVKLVSRGYKELIVGVFEGLEECQAFIAENYTEIKDIVYSNNKLTQRYLEKRKK